MTKQLEILIGISGSGKSTYAHEVWRNNPEQVIIINRDKIREFLFGYTESNVELYYIKDNVKKLEKQVTLYEEVLIKEGLAQNKHVIVDATHLKPEYIDRYRRFNVPTSFKFFLTDFDDCVERNKLRARSVPYEVLERQAKEMIALIEFESKNPDLFKFEVKSIFNDPTKPKCVVFDIDGTLSHNMGSRGPFEWDKVGLDMADFSVGFLYEQLNKINNLTIIICSGRDEVCLVETTRWFEKNFNGGFDFLYMRNNNDSRADWKVKYEMWEEICKDYYITFLVDDRCQVVDYARSLGLKVFQVEYNNF